MRKQAFYTSSVVLAMALGGLSCGSMSAAQQSDRPPHQVPVRGSREESPPPARDLLTAALMQDYALAERFLHKGADVNLRDQDGKTPLMLVLGDGYPQSEIRFLRLLLRHGADINARDHEGNSALYLALDGYTPLQVASFLVRHGADLRSTPGDSILEDAIYRGNHHTEAYRRDKARGLHTLVRDLLAHGADVNMHSSDSARTPLHIAAIIPDSFYTRILLRHGAKVDARDSEGSTPLMLAVYYDNAHDATLLVEAGADLGAKDNNNWSVLNWAIENENRDDVLIERFRRLCRHKTRLH